MNVRPKPPCTSWIAPIVAVDCAARFSVTVQLRRRSVAPPSTSAAPGLPRLPLTVVFSSSTSFWPFSSNAPEKRATLPETSERRSTIGAPESA